MCEQSPLQLWGNIIHDIMIQCLDSLLSYLRRYHRQVLAIFISNQIINKVLMMKCSALIFLWLHKRELWALFSLKTQRLPPKWLINYQSPTEALQRLKTGEQLLPKIVIIKKIRKHFLLELCVQIACKLPKKRFSTDSSHSYI